MLFWKKCSFKYFRFYVNKDNVFVFYFYRFLFIFIVDGVLKYLSKINIEMNINYIVNIDKKCLILFCILHY